jgi:hypothetical protein
MRAVRRVWRGELPLAEAFWNWAVIGGLAVNLGCGFLALALVASGRPLMALAIGHGLSVPFNILAGVGVWRAAGRCSGDPRWPHALRLGTAAALILLSIF